MPALYQAYRSCEPWQRAEGFEDLFELLDEIATDESGHRDRGEPLTPRA
jgi:hypothetical protein